MQKPTALIAVLVQFVAVSWAAATAPEGAWGVYNVVSAVTRVDVVPVDRFTLTIGPAEEHNGHGGTWWELAAEKPDGTRYAMRALSERVPMVEPDAPGRLLRYILKEGDEAPLEYVDAETGLALLPQFDFVRWFVPQAAATALYDGGFATCGEYLGHALSLDASGSGQELAPWVETERLVLDPGLMIGTARSMRDVEGTRLTGRNYTYRQFKPADYDEMLAAGVNYFRIGTAVQEECVRRRAFYDQTPYEGFRYPEMLCRSNYLGMVMFMDEPAILMVWQRHVFERVSRNEAMANLLRLRVRQRNQSSGHYGTYMLDDYLRRLKTPLGLMVVREWDYPVWETLTPTACYQLEAGCRGIVEEGRYDTADEVHTYNLLFGGSPDWTARELLLMHYAWLRGGARAFDKDWGMAIYGQADPSISPLAVTLAYDMGARYIWFWTSDHDHHLPFPEQMELARIIREHEAAHPRRPRRELVCAARAAVALPEGYTVDRYSMWGSPYIGLSHCNEFGVSDREIITTALFEGLRLLKRGVDFDFVIDTPAISLAGYERVVYVRRDGSVDRVAPR